jgi:bifunctional DNase/RNase
MELARILIRELADYQIIELREVLADPTHPLDDEAQLAHLASARKFPIVIGLPEAQAIERRLKNIPVKRPQTHDLLASVISTLGARLDSICITDLDDHTFFAALRITRADGEPISIDARPSDAIALGIAQQVPIFVEEHVLEGALREET